ncbi:folylpolyglutamate synthase/dihydrofolate synthase family protein [Rhizorhapis sp.]|uniref:bifunctional folylpolyglutamate synthase/dihydrofolate synthase n=1 Tax=Rhizorhapis sp. TaxID=1968842 RepID=UPI002B46D3C8|nr:folylpolyglutamate synthase/dihydrofolate synthase family protein [Rhizorhapis sp.]HKR17381.1 folylpolyglutamate synthase/dihydrofolate synthase family protein [Rhizorhapis sp.]
MPDHARSSDPAVQAQLDRLAQLSPGRDILGLERITALLARLGDPQHELPPVLHVAGTNGKGSTCAFLRAALEADGKSVHVFTSPHLVRFNERIRINGKLISDANLAGLLARVLDRAGDVGASFFEVTTAAAFLAFAENAADACIVEVGLGGRLDATNVIPSPAVCGVAQLGLDHQAFLGSTLVEIAREKAGISKAGAPLVTMKYPSHIAQVVEAAANQAEASWFAMGRQWDAAVYREKLHYRDEQGRLELALPRLSGPHQPMNAALATAMLRHQQAMVISESALRAAPLWAQWPARLQRLENGPLISQAPAGAELWLDGGHNPAAGEALARHFQALLPPRQGLHLVLGMLANKDPKGFLEPLKPFLASLRAVPVPGHEHHEPSMLADLASGWGIAGSAHDNVAKALSVPLEEQKPVILIAGSLYLAGEVLRENEQLPD